MSVQTLCAIGVYLALAAMAVAFGIALAVYIFGGF
jgi:hypothetical protein